MITKFEVGGSFRFLSLRISSEDSKTLPTYSMGFLMQKRACWTALFKENRLSRSCQLGQNTSLQSTFPPTRLHCSLRWEFILLKNCASRFYSYSLSRAEHRKSRCQSCRSRPTVAATVPCSRQPMWRIFVTAHLCQERFMLIANNSVIGFSKC